MSFGKYKDKTIYSVFFNHPEYILYLLDGHINKNRDEYHFIKRIISQIDKIDFIKKCSVKDCPNPAKFLSVYRNNHADGTVVCSMCDPYEMGAFSPAQLVKISQFEHLKYIDDNYKKDVLNKLMEVKGFEGNYITKRLNEFLGL